MRKSSKPSPFEVLGVSPSDDYATIRKTWKKLVKANHPDLRAGEKEAATRRLTALNAAFDRLRNHVPIRQQVPAHRKPARPAPAQPAQATGTTPRPAEARRAASQRRAEPQRRPQSHPHAARPAGVEPAQTPMSAPTPSVPMQPAGVPFSASQQNAARSAQQGFAQARTACTEKRTNGVIRAA